MGIIIPVHRDNILKTHVTMQQCSIVSIHYISSSSSEFISTVHEIVPAVCRHVKGNVKVPVVEYMRQYYQPQKAL